jgi:hypothetical protein
MKHQPVIVYLCAFLCGTNLLLGCDGIIGPPPPYRTWKTPLLLAAGSFGGVPQISCNDSGDAIAVWWQSCSNNKRIFADHFAVGKGWESAQVIDSNSVLGNAINPQVSVDSSGNAIAIWNQIDGTKARIYTNHYMSRTCWDVDQIIDSNTGDAWFSHIAVDGSGGAIAIWVQFDGMRNRIWVTHYSPGSGWDSARIIDSNTEFGNADLPQVSVNVFGDAIAVWVQSDGTKNRIWANHYSSGKNWEAAQPIDYNSGDACYPQIAIDGFGDAIAVWVQSDGTKNRIWTNYYSNGKNWVNAQPIDSNFISGDACIPQVAINSSGDTIAVWQQLDDTKFRIWANHYTIGYSWDGAQIIDTGIWGNMVNPHVAIDSCGNAIAIWEQYDSVIQFAVWASRFSLFHGNYSAI